MHAVCGNKGVRRNDARRGARVFLGVWRDGDSGSRDSRHEAGRRLETRRPTFEGLAHPRTPDHAAATEIRHFVSLKKRGARDHPRRPLAHDGHGRPLSMRHERPLHRLRRSRLGASGVSVRLFAHAVGPSVCASLGRRLDVVSREELPVTRPTWVPTALRATVTCKDTQTPHRKPAPMLRAVATRTDVAPATRFRAQERLFSTSRRSSPRIRASREASRSFASQRKRYQYAWRKW